MKSGPGWAAQLWRLLALLLLSAVALQLVFVLRIGLMTLVDPQSTAFQRSEAWRLLTEQGRILWSQDWVADDRLSNHLKRAVIASEDAGFADHSGVEWDAIEKAWERNQHVEERALAAAGVADQRHELAGLHLQVHVPQDPLPGPAVGEPLPDAFDLQAHDRASVWVTRRPRAWKARSRMTPVPM